MLHSHEQAGVSPVNPALIVAPSAVRSRTFAALLLVAVPFEAAAASAVELVDAGRFAAAEAHIAHTLSQPGTSAAQRDTLEFQRERMRRIRLDFTLSDADAMTRLRKHIPDLRDADFAAWDAAGLIESYVIDGRKYYFNRAPSNLFRLSADALARRKDLPAWTDGPLEKPHSHHREVIEQALGGGRKHVAPRRVSVTHSLTVAPDAVPAGETVRAWLPFPRALAGQQQDIRLTASVPAGHAVAPESALQRSVYLEQPAQAGKPTLFSVSYELTVLAQYHPIDPDKVVAAPRTAALAEHLAERPPHIVFTDAMRDFSRQVIGDETRPYHIARRLFDAVDGIPWAGAREYSTITNLGDYTLRAQHGDCGQQTLLLMTLLRLNGIPARWQSGWVYSEGSYDNMHDWGALYLAPYGWVPMDVTFGRFDSGDPRIDGFYLGGLDAYRIAFNDDYERPLVPAKQHFRSDTVDQQRGEVEWRGGNLYYDQWDYGFEARVLPRP
jgi:transglutaminase-like putative cysteine protease